MAKSESSFMQPFIQTMYGTVLGLTFYNITKAQNKSKWHIARTRDELGNFFTWKVFKSFIFSDYLFQFALFFFMLLIISHDWFSYHREKKENYQPKTFWAHVPQIFALFFLAQMFNVIDSLNFRYWFGFGFLYTICNVISHHQIKEKHRKINWKKYGIHFLLTGIGFYCVPESFKCPDYQLALAIAMFLVIVLWFYYRKSESIELTENKDANEITDEKALFIKLFDKYLPNINNTMKEVKDAVEKERIEKEKKHTEKVDGLEKEVATLRAEAAKKSPDKNQGPFIPSP